MNKWLLFLLCATLSACVTVQKEEPQEEYIDITDELRINKPKVIIKTKTNTVTKKVEVGCPPMPAIKLKPTPAAPKAALQNTKGSDYSAMDSILLNYIKQLREVNNSNIATVRAAIANNNKKCKK